MRVFYGVQGTGNGHISRARALAKHLAHRGIETQFLFSGREPSAYFDMQVFGDYWVRQGLTFVTERGKIKLRESLSQNNLRQLAKDIRHLDLSNYDLVLSDFEPITSWSARRQGRQCVSLGHQCAFDFPIPVEGSNQITRLLMRYFAPGDYRLGLHWHHFNQPILPPIVDLDHASNTSRDDFVLVYLGFESPDDVIPLLQGFPHQAFHYYGKFSTREVRDNVSLCPLSVDGFKQDLQRCRGVICNAGFELASEALQLGKPILVKPLSGQMEQLSNALALEQLGLGGRMNDLSPDAIGQWLTDPKAPNCQFPDVAEAIVDWILEEQRPPIQQLADDLWSRTVFSGKAPTQSNHSRSASMRLSSC